MHNGPTVALICGHRYRDAKAAIEWLCTVIGFERHAVYEGKEGQVEHAELTLGEAMMMLGSIRETEFSQYMKQPQEIGGAETRSLYIMVPDPDAVYARAKSSGAEMLLDIRDESYGGRGFTCRDPEGHIWSVGSYNPWQQK